MTADPYTACARLCDDDGIVRKGLMHNGTNYTCTGHAHFAGEHYRCESPAHPGNLPGPLLDALQGGYLDPSNPDQAGDWYANQPSELPSFVLASEADYCSSRCVVMPCCGFTFDAGHTDDAPGPPQYTCPLCSSPGLRRR